MTNFDLIIRSARVLDGTGSPWFRADLGIRDGAIASIGPLARAAAERTIDARDLVLAPGFIDIHNHAQNMIQERPEAEHFVAQGITTVISGPDGGSPHPLAEFLDGLSHKAIALNYGTFVGLNTAWSEVVGLDDRRPTSDEIARMQQIVREAMQAGAFGLSSGLKYLPACFAEAQEVIEVARPAAELGGIYISHIREEGLGLLDAVAECIQVGEEAGMPTQITHHKVVGADMWGRSRDTLRMVDEARARGVDVTIDQYPYDASQAGITILFPTWSKDGGDTRTRERLRDPDTRERIRQGLIHNLIHDRGGNDPARVRVARCEAEPDAEGLTLHECLAHRGIPATLPAAADLILDWFSQGQVAAIYQCLADEDVERIMAHPATMVSSDGSIDGDRGMRPHPRWYGTFPRVLGRYARDKGTLPLATAVHKMTARPAARLGLADRGLVRPGMKADLVVFDPDLVADQATFTEPRRSPTGIEHVLVNGVAVIEGGQPTGQMPGQVLRRR